MLDLLTTEGGSSPPGDLFSLASALQLIPPMNKLVTLLALLAFAAMILALSKGALNVPATAAVEPPTAVDR